MERTIRAMHVKASKIRRVWITLTILFLSCAQSALSVDDSLVYDLDSRTLTGIDSWLYQHVSQRGDVVIQPADLNWQPVSLARMQLDPGVCWLKKQIILKGQQDDAGILALYFDTFPSAIEVYWDGALVGKNGVIGNGRYAARVGSASYLLPIGRARTGPGIHTVLLRVMQDPHLKPFIRPSAKIGYESALDAAIKKRSDVYLLNIGLFLAASLLGFFLYGSGFRNPSLLFLSSFSLVQLFESIWEYAYTSGVLRVDFALWSAPVVLSGIIGSALLLLFFILWQFQFRRRTLHIGVAFGIICAAVLFAGDFDAGMRLAYLLLFLYGFGLSALTWKTPGGAILTMGFMIFLLYVALAKLAAYDARLHWALNDALALIASALFLACLMGSIIRRIREQMRQWQELQIKSKRLEVELLKKSIQPHFIMNTLSTVKSLLTRNAAGAEKLIESLAEEFRIISRISSQKEIALQEEIGLCRRHLEIMGFRRDATYQMTVADGCPDTTIPPMVLHTLMENGLTHAYEPQENGRFHLECRRTPEEIVYRLRNGGSRISKIAALPPDAMEEGMGLRYVKARLEESYPKHWRLQYGCRDGEWEVEIGLTGQALR
jgi:two-component sensor histidine kinase